MEDKKNQPAERPEPRTGAVAVVFRRLLSKLSSPGDAQIVVAGPTTPLHSLMFDFGIKILAGLVVEDEESVWRTVAEGGQRKLFSAGSRMVTVSVHP